MYPIIMAGGSGTRLWPISRRLKPKQVFPLIDKETLLQKTWKRLRLGFSPSEIYLTTGDFLTEEVKKQLPEIKKENLCLEPARRDTAAALGLALLKISQRDPCGVFAYINADNFVRDKKEFIRKIKLARKIAAKQTDRVVLLGVNPSYPETGYGYIKMGKLVKNFQNEEIFEVEEFVEKPDLKTAKQFLSKWEYLWNPTLIVGRVDTFLSFYKKYLPKMWRILEKIAADTGAKKEFLKIKPISIDYGILEPAARDKKLLVMPADFGWSDVGHWLAIKEILAKKGKENICRGGQCVILDSQDNLVYSMTGKVVALAGVKGMIIVETEDSLLICRKEQAQDVKKIVEKMKKKKMDIYL